MIRDAWEADLDAIVGIDNAAIPGRVATATTAEQRRAEVEVLLAPVFLTPAFPHWDRPWPGTPESIARSIEVSGTPALQEVGLF